jgi:hypothetical protein
MAMQKTGLKRKQIVSLRNLANLLSFKKEMRVFRLSFFMRLLSLANMAIVQ